MDPASAAAGSIGIPPLNLSQGPATAMGHADGRVESQNRVTSGTGDFVFKGTGRQTPGIKFEDMSPLLLVAGLGGVAWLIAKRFL